MRTTLPMLLICLLASVPVAWAEGEPPAAAVGPQENPFTAHHRGVYHVVQKILLRAAEKMPEEGYGFQPTEAVRSFGGILGHVADSQYYFCSVALGEENPAPKIEKSRTSKAELIAALGEAFTYCDRAYDGMTDASGADLVVLMGGDTPQLGVLGINHMHLMEHYGNLVTYLRMKDIVPPTSEPEFMATVNE
jgi:uncharacterized damage-inducible protein DinB